VGGHGGAGFMTCQLSVVSGQWSGKKQKEIFPGYSKIYQVRENEKLYYLLQITKN
jgi:hypothetical protein